MKIYLFIERLFDKLLYFIWYCFIYIHEMKNIILKRKLYKNIILTKEQKNEIDNLWIKNYGKRIPYYWHRLYQSYTGKFDACYFPEYIYSLDIEPKCIKRHDCRSFGDKNLLDIIFHNSNNNVKVKIPFSYVKCINGIYYNSNRELLSFKRVLDILSNVGEVIVKKTVNSNSGRGVYLCDFINGIDIRTKKTIRDTIIQIGKDFIVQEKLKPHETYRKIYPNSINTIRIVTYVLNNQIYYAPLTMRIGQGGNYLDNAHAGGMFIGLNDKGILEKEAYTEYQKRFIKHPDTNILFEGYKVFGVSEIIKTAIYLHPYIPKSNFISWDFMIDEKGDIVLIEVNLESQTVWFPQIANGTSFFGDNTEKMIQYARRGNAENH